MNGQSRRGSLLESVVNVAIGLLVALGAQIVIFPLLGIHISIATDLTISAAFTAVSLVRSFALRRLFESFRK